MDIQFVHRAVLLKAPLVLRALQMFAEPAHIPRTAVDPAVIMTTITTMATTAHLVVVVMPFL